MSTCQAQLEPSTNRDLLPQTLRPEKYCSKRMHSMEKANDLQTVKPCYKSYKHKLNGETSRRACTQYQTCTAKLVDIVTIEKQILAKRSENSQISSQFNAAAFQWHRGWRWWGKRKTMESRENRENHIIKSNENVSKISSLTGNETSLIYTLCWFLMLWNFLAIIFLCARGKQSWKYRVRKLSGNSKQFEEF